MARDRIDRFAGGQQPACPNVDLVESARLVKRHQTLAIGLPLDEGKPVAIGQAQLAAQLVFREAQIAGKPNGCHACSRYGSRTLAGPGTELRLMAELVG